MLFEHVMAREPFVKGKLNSRFLNSMLLGRTELSDEWLVFDGDTVWTTRSVRRRLRDESFSNDLFKALKSTPWSVKTRKPPVNLEQSAALPSMGLERPVQEGPPPAMPATPVAVPAASVAVPSSSSGSTPSSISVSPPAAEATSSVFKLLRFGLMSGLAPSPSPLL